MAVNDMTGKLLTPIIFSSLMIESLLEAFIPPILTHK